MEDELLDAIDETMEINHQITENMIRIIEADIEGVKVNGKDIGIEEVEKNKIIKTLFERLQEKYNKIEDYLYNDEKENEEDDEKEEYSFIQIVPDYDMDDIGELEDYLRDSYIALRYITVYDESGNVDRNSIYRDKPFEIMHTSEYFIQIANLRNIATRQMNNEKEEYSFIEKAAIIDDIAKKTFYKNMAMQIVEDYIEEFESQKEYLDPEMYSKIRGKLYEQKYAVIYEYLHNKYNGIIREGNNIGKLKYIDKYLEENSEYLMLNISKYDFDENIKIRMGECIDNLRDRLEYAENIEFVKNSIDENEMENEKEEEKNKKEENKKKAHKGSSKTEENEVSIDEK